MLPTHNTSTNAPTTTSEHTSPTIKHYTIKSSDVIDQQSRITVEGDEGALWYKTRELTEHEIVDSLTDAKTNQTRWTIHQPAKKGWYLRLRSPLFPPGACIALTPPPPSQSHQGRHSAQSPSQQKTTPGGAGGADGRSVGNGAGGGTAGAEPMLVFGCQTLVPSPINVLASTSTGTGMLSNRSSVDHSYPPSRTSTSSVTQPPAYSVESDQTVDITQGADTSSTHRSSIPTAQQFTVSAQKSPVYHKTFQPPLNPTAIRWHVTHYTLQTGIPTAGVLAGTHHHPHLVHPSTHIHQLPQPSLFQRALAPLAHLAGAGSSGSVHHFTIQPASIPQPQVGPSSSSSPDPSVPSNTTESSTFGASSTSSALSPSPTPFIAFTDSTPLLRATPSGTLSVDVEHVRRLGVELAFWVTVSLAFWEFLREREGYLAASED